MIVPNEPIMIQLEKLSRRYLDTNGEPLLMAGPELYLHPDQALELANKFNFEKVNSFDIDDESIIDAIIPYLENKQMVIIVPWTKEKRIDLYFDPKKVVANSKKDDGCFIATSVYGSEVNPNVLILRSFRDGFLLKSLVGKSFVRLYYFVSPPIAQIIGSNLFLSQIIRYFFVDPIVKCLQFLFKKE
jgi:hypothetical protein